MAKIRRRDNFCVVVTPRSPGDFRIGSISGIKRSEDESEKLCEEIAEQIRRHMDELPSSWMGGNRGVSVTWDSAVVCSLCGLEWEVDDDGTPCCCNAAIAEFDAAKAERKENAQSKEA